LRIGTLLTTVALSSFLSIGAARADAPIAEEPEHGQPAAPKASKKGKKKRARGGAVFSGRLASASELRNEPLDKPSGHIELYAVNFRESLDVDLYKDDGSIDEEAIDKLNHLWRCRRTDTEKSIDPRLYEMLSRIYDRFGKRIELVSGFRNQQRTSSFHFHGSASDIRIPGVSEKELHQFVQTLDTGGMGIGIYPRAGFIHVDIRPEPSFRWVDYSPPGSSDMGHPHKSKRSKKSVPNA
jgi:uncharacterized protein YcbK (DUF882 family)